MIRKQRTFLAHKGTFIILKQILLRVFLPKNPRLKFDGETFGGRADRHKRFVGGIYVEMHKGSTTLRNANTSHCEGWMGKEGEFLLSASPSNALGCIYRDAYLGAPQTLPGDFRRREPGFSYGGRRVR